MSNLSVANNADIAITQSAGAHIVKQLATAQATYLRLGIKASGCNGYQYTLDFLESPTDEDVRLDFANDVHLCIAPGDLPLVQGTEIDLVTEGLNSALVFKNSRATSYCGCGESFAFSEPTAQAGDAQAAANLATDVGSN